MTRAMQWLRNHKLPTFIIAIIYFCLVIMPHEWVGHRVNFLFSGMPRARYDLIILIFSLAILLILFAAVFNKIKNHEEKTNLILSFAFTLVCITLVNNYLFTVNIESVHYVQYAIASFLLFALIENYFVVLFVAFLIGVFDEAYQYFYLAPGKLDYFDINDVITNLLGAAFGLLLLKTFKVTESKNRREIFMKGFVIPFVVLVLAMIILLQTNILSVYPSDDEYMIIRKIPDGFWSVSPPPSATFHIVQPLEGLLMLIFLFVVYFFCFRSKIAEKN